MFNKQNPMLTRIFVLSLLVLTAGCTNNLTRVEQDFGNSVRHMINAQIYDPKAAENPPTQPPTELDGTKGEKVLSTYREDVYKPEKAEQPLRIQIGR
jgi:type IV pilus biogenesis protein CpaD/CtpE